MDAIEPDRSRIKANLVNPSFIKHPLISKSHTSCYTEVDLFCSARIRLITIPCHRFPVRVGNQLMRLQNPIGLMRLRTLGCSDGTNFVTARRIDHTVALSIIEEGKPSVSLF
jgi:hypothetical protein